MLEDFLEEETTPEEAAVEIAKITKFQPHNLLHTSEAMLTTILRQWELLDTEEGQILLAHVRESKPSKGARGRDPRRSRPL